MFSIRKNATFATKNKFISSTAIYDIAHSESFGKISKKTFLVDSF